MSPRQPSPYGSLLTCSGVFDSPSLTATISPDSGAITSQTALTDSISAYGSSLLTVVRTAAVEEHDLAEGVLARTT